MPQAGFRPPTFGYNNAETDCLVYATEKIQGTEVRKKQQNYSQIKKTRIMPQNLANELNSLDFGTLIGGPLQAAVNAQNDAALAQVNYIKAVGFNPITAVGNSSEIIGHSLKMVDFNYQEGTGETATHYTFSMPLLSMLNIPALRIDEMTIDFNAKLTSVETAETKDSVAASANLGLSYGKLASLKASASYQKPPPRARRSTRPIRCPSMSVW